MRKFIKTTSVSGSPPTPTTIPFCQQIDGRAFLLLTQRDIVKIMSVKLGPALKIYNSILMFKHVEDDQSTSSDPNIT